MSVKIFKLGSITQFPQHVFAKQAALISHGYERRNFNSVLY